MPASTRTMLARTLGVVFMVNFLLIIHVLDTSISSSSSGRPNERRTEPQTELPMGNLHSCPFQAPQHELMAEHGHPARISAKSNPWKDGAESVPPALGLASVRKAGRYRSPQPSQPPAGS